MDLDFNVGTIAHFKVIRTTALQPDGKCLLGVFFEIAGEVRQGLARLHPDGALDESFDPGTGPAIAN